MRRILFAGAGALLASSMCLAARADCQIVHGTVRDARVGGRSGIVLELLDSHNAVLSRALSGDSGFFSLRAPHAGVFRIRALRLGEYPTMSAPVYVTNDAPAPVQVLLNGAPIQLPGQAVSAESVCRTDPDSGSQMASVWSEIRTALTSTMLTRSQENYQIMIERFRQSFDATGAHLIEERHSQREEQSTQPFAAMAPDTLARLGYVVHDTESTTFYAPDANVLLSSEFAGSHCFTLRTGEDSTHHTQLGLEFEPVEAAGDHVDVSGVLWVDAATRELRSADFAYVGLPDVLDPAHAGGHLDFLRLADDRWIVQKWYIRMPVAATETRTFVAGAPPPGSHGVTTRSRIVLAAIDVTGGEVLAVRRGDQFLWSR